MSDENTLMRLRQEELKRKLEELKRIARELTLDNYNQILKDTNNPITQALIVLVAWGVLNFMGFLPFFAILATLSFLLGPWGLILIIAVLTVYHLQKDAIQSKLDEFKVKGEYPRTGRKRNITDLLKDTWDTTRLGFEVNQTIDKIQNIYTEIGKRTFELYKQGRKDIKNDYQIQKHFDEIKKIEKQLINYIDELQKRR